MIKWQPIKTTPKKFTNILLYIPYNDNPIIGYWSEIKSKWIENSEYIDITQGDCCVSLELDAYSQPSHWMALPKPPKKKGI
jgi:hypothetical protein